MSQCNRSSWWRENELRGEHKRAQARGTAATTYWAAEPSCLPVSALSRAESGSTQKSAETMLTSAYAQPLNARDNSAATASSFASIRTQQHRPQRLEPPLPHSANIDSASSST